MMKKISIALAFVLIAGCGLAARSQTQKKSGIKNVDFGNFSYRTSFDGAANPKTIRLTDGKFEDGGSYQDGGTLYELFDKPIYGDLNGDKNDEAAVEIKMSAAPTLRSFEVQIFAFQNNAAKLLARLNADAILKDYQKYYPKTDLHYAGANPPKIQNRHLFVEALTEGSFACPKYTAVFDYKLSNNKFVLSNKPIRKSFNCSQ